MTAISKHEFTIAIINFFREPTLNSLMNEVAENDVTDGLPIGFNVDQRLQQVPCIISTLTRDIIYAPKLTNNN